MARPRSKRAHDKVVEAAINLFAAQGIEATSMDAIAEASGVSKATIYKHWPDKVALVLEVMSQVHCVKTMPELEQPDTRSKLITLLGFRPPQPQSEVQQRMAPHLMAFAARNPEFGKAWRIRVMEPPRAQMRTVLERSMADGELPEDLDLDLSVALLFGPMMYRHVLNMIGAQTPEDMPERVVDAFWKAHAVTRSHPAESPQVTCGSKPNPVAS